MEHWAGASTFFTASVFLHLLLFFLPRIFTLVYSHYRGSTDPMDVDKWLANKQVFLMFISRFAKKEKSTEIFCIGAMPIGISTSLLHSTDVRICALIYIVIRTWALYIHVWR